MSIKPRDYPFWMRAIAVAILALFAVNLFFFVAPLTALIRSIAPTKVDLGLATLVSILAGLGFVAWQVRSGFNNVIRSQETRQEIEQRAREHQALLERKVREDNEQREIRQLAALLQAELVVLSEQVGAAREWAVVQQAFFEEMAKEGIRSSTRTVPSYSFRVPVFEHNVGRIGLIGASHAADVVMVASRALATRPEMTEKPLPNEILAAKCKGLIDEYDDWQHDLQHVAMRLRALEFGLEDPGTLLDAQTRRLFKAHTRYKGEKEAKGLSVWKPDL
jgi:hypothetical protein